MYRYPELPGATADPSSLRSVGMTEGWGGVVISACCKAMRGLSPREKFRVSRVTMSQPVGQIFAMTVICPKFQKSTGRQRREQTAEGAGAFRPLNSFCDRNGFSRGPFVYASRVRLAPQETRTCFVTAVTAQRRSLFQVTVNAELLQQTIVDYRRQGRFLLHAFVIMPEHFHVVITPAPEVSLEKAMQFIKGGFSFRLKSKLDVWMRSLNETQIMSKKKYAHCVSYIEDNPVRRGLALTPGAYSFSSAVGGPFDAMPLHMAGK